MRNRLKALYSRHGIINAKIQGEQSRMRPDSLRVRALKKMRLKLLDQIEVTERRFALAH
jgi:hypothetical protein